MSNKNPSSTSVAALTALMGFISAGIGSFFMLAGADVIHLNPDDVHAPLWVIGGAGLMFFLAGMMIIVQGIAGPGAEQVALYKWLQYFMVLGMLASFAAIFIWVGLGPGEREFQSSTSIGPIGFINQGGEFLGRCLFGGFGVLMALGVLYFAISQPIQILGLKSKKPTNHSLQNGADHD
ncbi:MAG: hypothetical protein ISS57_03545 [Anaerolineales bacterium]|nr:hypothetical protein [Anaerolineales bacterium]